MSENDKIIKSPLNYIGGKYKLLPQILNLFPDDINTFFDLFCGGCNVGFNIKCKKIVFNDINNNLIGLYKTFKITDKKNIIKQIYKIINKYELSLSKEYGYSFYNCNSYNGLSSYNKEKFLLLRNNFNLIKKKDNKYYIMLYVLLVYSFNNQIRFNREGKYNLPVGKRDFNKNIENKLIRFIDKVQECNTEFLSQDYEIFDIKKMKKNDFIYIDPPYLTTLATYNENSLWNQKEEYRLLNYIDKINKYKKRFALSNVLESSGNKNSILIDWIKRSNYNVHYLTFSYANSNYQKKDKKTKAKEVLITNY